MRTPRLVTTLLSGVLIVGVLLTACGDPDDTHPGAGAAASLTGAAAYPVVVDNCGFDTMLARPPQRLVTIKSSMLELVLALGVQDRVVATAFSDGQVPKQWADEAASLPVLSDNLPGQEAILALKPDLVLAGWESNLTSEGAGDRALLAGLGVATYVAPSACKSEGYMPDPMTFDLLFDHFVEAGRVLGVPERAQQLVAQQRARLEQLEPDGRGLTALWYSSGKDTPYVGAGIGTPQMIMAEAGLTNVAAGVRDTWTSLGWEAVAAADPDVIVLVDAAWNTADSKIEYLRSNPVTTALSAVQKERFIVVPFPAAEAGVRTVDAVASVIDQLGDLES